MFIYICKQIYGNCNWNWRFRSKPLAWIKMAQSRGMQRVGWFMENVNILANIFFSGCFRCPNMVIRLDGMSPVLVKDRVAYPFGKLSLYLVRYSFALHLHRDQNVQIMLICWVRFSHHFHYCDPYSPDQQDRLLACLNAK